MPGFFFAHGGGTGDDRAAFAAWSRRTASAGTTSPDPRGRAVPGTPLRRFDRVAP
jgi:hypothetical protein